MDQVRAWLCDHCYLPNCFGLCRHTGCQHQLPFHKNNKPWVSCLHGSVKSPCSSAGCSAAFHNHVVLDKLLACSCCVCCCPPQVRRYAAELVAVLSHLHDNGVVYVDLKPENVLLQDCGHIMLCDMDLVHTQAEIEHVRELESGAAVVVTEPAARCRLQACDQRVRDRVCRLPPVLAWLCCPARTPCAPANPQLQQPCQRHQHHHNTVIIPYHTRQ